MSRDSSPTVDVIMPVRQEAAHIETALESIWQQDYPGPVNVVVALAPSSDGTGDVLAEQQRAGRPLTIVDNPTGTTPAGLNLALAAGTGDVVVRLDGHARIEPGYISTAVGVLSESGAVNVGGRQLAVGTTPFESAVAEAMHSVVGTGGAKFHVGGPAADVDTVYLGVFRRAALEAVGGFDERLIRNQDYELNIRLRRAGGRIRFDPRLAVRYTPRSSLSALARQYFEYGYWKSVVARMYPDEVRLRQAAPALLPVSLLGAVLLAARQRRWLAIPIAYVAGIVGASLPSRHRRRLMLVYPTMHLSWGVGFLVGLVRQREVRRQAARVS